MLKLNVVRRLVQTLSIGQSSMFENNLLRNVFRFRNVTIKHTGCDVPVKITRQCLDCYKELCICVGHAVFVEINFCVAEPGFDTIGPEWHELKNVRWNSLNPKQLRYLLRHNEDSIYINRREKFPKTLK